VCGSRLHPPQLCRLAIAIVEETVKTFGKLNCLVNNAAYQGKAVDGGLAGLDYERVQRTFIVSFFEVTEKTKQGQPQISMGWVGRNYASFQCSADARCGRLSTSLCTPQAFVVNEHAWGGANTQNIEKN